MLHSPLPWIERQIRVWNPGALKFHQIPIRNNRLQHRAFLIRLRLGPTSKPLNIRFQGQIQSSQLVPANVE